VSGLDGVRKSKNLDLQTQELQNMIHRIDKGSAISSNGNNLNNSNIHSNKRK